MNEFQVRLPHTESPLRIHINETTMQKILEKHLSRAQERWSAVLGADFIGQLLDRQAEELTPEEGLFVARGLCREVQESAALPRLISYYDMEHGFRRIRLLLSDRALVVVLRIPVRDESSERGDLLTAYVPLSAGGFHEGDRPETPSRIVLRRASRELVLKYCRLEDTPPRIAATPWQRTFFRFDGQEVIRNILGFTDATQWGFSGSEPGAAYVGRIPEPQSCQPEPIE